MAKRIGPEAKIIALFTALPDDSKRIVLDVIKSLNVTPRKAAINKPTRVTQPATDAKCGICGNIQAHSDHDRSYLKSHNFEPTKSAGKTRSRKSIATLAASTETGEVSALAAGGSGD